MRTTIKHALPKSLGILSLSMGLSALVGCGAANFAGGTKSTNPPGKQPPGSENQNPFSLSWEWGCGSQDSSIKEDETSITLVGPGPHEVPKQKVDGAAMYFKGKPCDASAAPRDVVFVVDVSGSMKNAPFSPGTDPMTGGTCGRMQALNQVMDIIEKVGEARFAVITFSTDVNQASSDLFTNKADTYADLLANSSYSKIENLICAGNGETNYNSGLELAESILNANREAGHVREIYFISDGEPSPSSKNGKAIAARLHKDTTVATVMVGGSKDAILRDYVASKDHLGAPLHARAQHSSKLAQVLSQLSANSIVSAEVLYGPTGGSQTKVNFSKEIAGSKFDFKAFTINTSDAPHGLTVEFKYRDRFGGEQNSVGELIWKDDL